MKTEPYYRGVFSGKFDENGSEADFELEQGYRCTFRGIATEGASRMEAIEKMMWIVSSLTSMLWL